MFDLINIFDIFLPQLLLYPNPADPLNAEAAALNQKNEVKYKEKVSKWSLIEIQVREYVKKYASAEMVLDGIDKEKGKEESKEDDKKSELSDNSELGKFDDIEDDLGDEEEVKESA